MRMCVTDSNGQQGLGDNGEYVLGDREPALGDSKLANWANECVVTLQGTNFHLVPFGCSRHFVAVRLELP